MRKQRTFTVTPSFPTTLNHPPVYAGDIVAEYLGITNIVELKSVAPAELADLAAGAGKGNLTRFCRLCAWELQPQEAVTHAVCKVSH